MTHAHTEHERLARVPGVAFAMEGDERVPRILGTGLEVFEVIQVYLALDRDRAKLGQAFSWLTDKQLQAALDYYEAFPEEVDAAIAENDECMTEG
jgi:uncharacterized protein (DUF433 family)